MQKRYIYLFRFFGVVAALFAVFMIHRMWTEAAYQGADVLGQLTTSDQPDFTKSLGNNEQGTRMFTTGGANISGIAVDTVHHRLFAGASQGRVLVFNLDSNNHITDRIADYILGKSDFNSFSGVGAGRSQSNLGNVRGLAYDAIHNRLFVNDSSIRVLVYDVSTITNGMNASYVLGQANFTDTTAAVTQSGMSSCFSNRMCGLAYDDLNDRLFVADSSSSRVLAFDVASGTIANGMNASYVLGQANFTSAVSSTAQNGMNLPTGLTYDTSSSRLFVGDFNSNRVLVFDVATSTIANGMNASYVLGQVDFTSNFSAVTSATTTHSVNGVEYDPVNKRLFVLSRNTHRATVFNVATSTISNGMSASYVIGQVDFTAASTATTQSGINFSNGDVEYDPTTNYLYLQANNPRLMVFDVTPATMTNGMNAIDLFGQLDEAGNPIYTTAAAGAAPLPSSRGFNGVRGVSLDTVNHRLFTVDTNNNRVLVFNLDGGNNLLDRIADNVLGQTIFTTSTAATTQSGMSTPIGVFYDSVNNRLFVGQQNNRVTVYDVSTITDGENATHVFGQPNFTSSTASTTQSGMSGVGVGMDYDYANDRLFVPDRANNRVLVFDVATATISNGMNASYVLGQPTFTSSTASTTQSGMSQPDGVVYDPVGNRLFVAEVGNNRVTVFDVATSTIANGANATHVLGQATFTSSTAATTQNGMQLPAELAYDSVAKRLFVSDFSNRRVLLFDVESITNGENAVGVLGKGDFVTSTSQTTQDGLSANEGLDFDPGNNRLYVGDTSNNRVLIYNLLRLPSSALSVGSRGGGDYTGRIEPGYSQGVSTCSLVNGSLPTGLTLTTSTCTVVGTPTIEGVTSFTVRATDEVSGIGNFVDDQDYSITIQPPTGGGGTIEHYLPPPTRIPPFAVSLIINGGATSTISRNVSISANASFSAPTPGISPSQTPSIILSNTDIAPNVFIPPRLHTSTMLWDLCATYGGYGPPDNPCREGLHIVSARVYSPWNVASDVVTSSIVYMPPGANPVSPYTSPLIRTASGTYEVAPPNPSAPSPPETREETPGLVHGKDFIGITRWLLQGTTGDDVLLLQKFLNQKGYLIGEQNGFFGSLTHAAVIQFQEAYFNQILAPRGFRRGTGIFATSTREFVIRNY